MADERDSTKTMEPPQGVLASLRYLGPGVILSAAIVGSGELIATTALGAKAGYVLLWAVLLGCVVKVGVQLEFGRHCITHGETAFAAWNRGRAKFVGLHWSVWIGFVYIVVNILGQGGVLGGAAQVLNHVLPEVGTQVWPWLIALSLALIVFHGRYGPIELICMALNLIFVVAVLYCLFAVQRSPFAIAGSDLAGGFSLALPRDALLLAVSAFGITGVGAGEIFVYPMWCMEKGYAAWAGPRDDSPEWAARARGWIRVMTLDALVSLVIYTVTTVGFYLLGAAVLHQQAVVSDGAGLILQLSTIFTEVLGEGAMGIFLFCAFAVLYSTAFSNCASNSRLWAEFTLLSGVVQGGGRSFRRLVGVFAFALPLGWAACYLLFEKPLLLVTIMGVANTLFLFVVAGQAMRYRYRETDPRLAPSRAYDTALWVSFVSLGLVGVKAAVDTLLV